MPLYEYKCDNCGDTFETLQRFSDAPLEVHPKCGGRVQRLLTAPSFQFKGSGWYITDYARKNGKPDAAKSESKPAPAAETKASSSDSSKP